MSNLRDGDRLVLYPRWTVDERLPVAERKEFTPTPKQMLYGQRAELIARVATEKDDVRPGDGGFAEVELKESRGGDWSKPFVFPAIQPPPGGRQALHARPVPQRLVRLLVRPGRQRAVRRAAERPVRPAGDAAAPGDGAGSPGQTAFLAGLDAFREAGLLHDFEIGKREFIGGHGRTPVLLVQGPPGTGKSYSAAFAVFARLQGAMKEERPYRVSVDSVSVPGLAEWGGQSQGSS